MLLHLTINGNEYFFEKRITLFDLLLYLSINT